jgi:hypothetical protein
MKKRSSAGISHTVVIIFVGLSFIGLLTVYLIGAEVRSIEEQISRKHKNQMEIEERMREVTTYLVRVSPLIMPVDPNVILDVEKVSKYLEEKNKNYTLFGKDLTLQNIVLASINKLFETEYKLTRSSYEKDASSKQESKLKEFHTEIISQYGAYTSQLNQRRDELVNKRDTENEKYLLLKENLNNRKRQKEEELPVIEEDFRKRIIRLENERDSVKYALEELSLKEAYSRDIVETYAQTFKVDSQNRWAFITLGSNDKIIRGLKLMAYRQQKGFIRKWKGQLEVKKVFDTYSLVSITKVEDEGNPIIDGDYVTNIFYYPINPRAIVLIGMFKKGVFKYDRDEIEQRLLDIGTIVEKNVSLKTDFIIVGEDPEEIELDRKNFEMAKKLNIPRLEGEEAKKSIEYYLGE